MKQVILYNEAGEKLEFGSIADASKVLGIKYQKLRWDLLSKGGCLGYSLFKAKTVKELLQDSEPTREELDIPHYATINGKKFVAVKCDNKTNCKDCDILKLDPPKWWLQKPLCYDYNCGTHKIVDICSRYRCIWKRK